MPHRKRKSETPTYTYADYLTWGENQRCELIDGVVYSMTPSPSKTHADISKALFRQLDLFFQGKSCQVYYAPLDVRLPKKDQTDENTDTVVQPDIIVVCDESKLDEKGCRGAPDLVIEILSPSTASKDHITKKRLYETAGVKEYWLISPGDRIVTLYRRTARNGFGPAQIFGDTDIVSVSLFPGLEIDMKMLFPPLPPVVREPGVRYL
ncbi:MAG TPA: Uma2 family endonuclease [Candidatus Ozemobacteraceae bacterium]|nr:Uma2 family endonuclease [Candidatus Ozemobacteraceae bacterium]